MSMPATGPGVILVPLDGSKFAETVVPLALSMARATHRRIRLCHVRLLPLWPEEVVGPDTADAMRRILHAEGESYLKEVQLRIQSSDVPVEVVILPGDAVSAGEILAHHVEQSPVDLIIMGTHGLGGLRRVWLGSVADYLVRHLTTPVLLVRPGMDERAGHQRILVPLDGSPLGEQAIDLACDLARAHDRELVLVRVVSPVVYPVAMLEVLYAGIDMNLTALVRTEAENYLRRISDGINARGIKCHDIVMLETAAADCIVDMARPGGFSMVVMTTHGRGGLKRLMLGSVTDKVVRAAEVPVLVYRPKADSEPAAASESSGGVR
jgi:nucleotide-binding universal stress UspA family protein